MKSQSRKIIGLSLVAGALLGLSTSAFSIGGTSARNPGGYPATGGIPAQHRIDASVPVEYVVVHHVVHHKVHHVYTTQPMTMARPTSMTMARPTLYQEPTSTSVSQHSGLFGSRLLSPSIPVGTTSTPMVTTAY